MNPPDKCPFCQSEVLTENGKPCFSRDGSWASYSCLTTIHFELPDINRFQSRECLTRQRDQLAARVKELEAKREEVAVRNLSNMLHVEGLNRKIDRLIDAGDAFADTAEPTAWENWVKAKETKP